MNYYTSIPLINLLPEIIVASSALITVLFAAFLPTRVRLASLIMSAVVIAVLFLLYNFGYDHPNYAMGKWEIIFKMLIASASLIVIYSVGVYPFKQYSIEFICLVLLGLVGGFVVVSARDFLTLFMGVELQALVGYVMAAFNREEAKSSEAGLKYFSLGALITCLGLWGISLIYGFTGNIDYYLVAEAIAVKNDFALAMAATLVMFSILFKLSAAPFHSWTPDVYEGSPLLAVTVFTTSMKIAMIAAIINLLSIPFLALDYIQQLLEYIAIISMIVGALGGIAQTNVKRLMGYSTIMNIGFVLAAIAINRDALAVFYLVVYALASMAFLLSIKMLKSKDSECMMLDLASLPKGSRLGGICAIIFLFSMAGIPPFAGFFAKFYILLEAISQAKYLLVAVAVCTSILAAYYYLKMVRYMYFEAKEHKYVPLNPSRRSMMPWLLFFAVVILCAGFQFSL